MQVELVKGEVALQQGPRLHTSPSPTAHHQKQAGDSWRPCQSAPRWVHHSLRWVHHSLTSTRQPMQDMLVQLTR